MPKDERTKPEITHGIKRTGQRALYIGGEYIADVVPIAEGRGSVTGCNVQNIPRPLRRIPVLSRTGRVVGHCHPALVYTYA